MPSKVKKEMTPEMREKMLERLAEGRKKIAENREKRKAEFAEKGEDIPPAKVFEKKIPVNKPTTAPAPPAILPATPAPTRKSTKLPNEDKLEKIASQLEELTSYKREKIEIKKKKEEEEIKIKKDKEENEIKMKKEKEEQDLKNKLARLEELEKKEQQKNKPVAVVDTPTTPLTISKNDIIFPRSYGHKFFNGGRF